jgi:hypothetical protein
MTDLSPVCLGGCYERLPSPAGADRWALSATSTIKTRANAAFFEVARSDFTPVALHEVTGSWDCVGVRLDGHVVAVKNNAAVVSSFGVLPLNVPTPASGHPCASPKLAAVR